MNKQVGVGIDGVLNYYPMCWVEYVNQSINTGFKSLDEMKQSLPKDSYNELKDKYRRSRYKACLEPRRGAREFLLELEEKGYHVVILTSRPFDEYPGMRGMTKQWLKKNGFPFEDVMQKNMVSGGDFVFCVDDEPIICDSYLFVFRGDFNVLRREVYHFEVNQMVEKFKNTSMYGFWKDYTTGEDAPHYSIPYKGYMMTKLPSDVFIYPHLLRESKPMVLVEIGTQRGGSARFFADILREWDGWVVTVDIGYRKFREDNIVFIHGDINNGKTVEQVVRHVEGCSCCVVDDGSHKTDEVYRAFENLNCLIPSGGFYIIEDGFTNAILCKEGYQPHIAIGKILKNYQNFELYPFYDKFVFSTVFKGILKRGGVV